MDIIKDHFSSHIVIVSISQPRSSTKSAETAILLDQFENPRWV